ncbi:MAG TPA: LuxR C-terminal-related transcriptional regulator, partial [Actinoplanes sp.]|nr:LuxR C-terminal-related transcriptional regulator [Actinoplanes sp.]
AMSVGAPTAGAIMVEAARMAHAAAATHRSHPADQILYGLATRVLEGYASSVTPLRTAITAFCDSEPDPRTTRWLGLAGLIAADLWDEQTWLALGRRYPTAFIGADPAMPSGNGAYRAPTMPRLGWFETARDRLDATQAPELRADAAPMDYSALLLSAWQGRRLRLDNLLSHASHNACGHGTVIAGAVAVAVLRNGLGHYNEAVEAARQATRAEHPGLTGWALMELVEAAARSGQPETAAGAAARLAERTSAAGTDWALGVQATAQALLIEGEHAERRYREAVERLARTGIRCQLARAQLLYGEWLRRRNRRIDARTQLRAARDLFTVLGASAFADRAHRELLATGEAARKRTIDCRCQLTPQETRIACLARDGLSNPEIAGRLFVSPRTVEYHLHKVFAKLAITSRAKLHLVLDPRSAGGSTDPDAG